MNSERDVARIVRAWLRTDEHESADHILDDVLAMVDTNTQRPAAWSIWRISRMNSPLRLVSAAAAAVVVVVAVGVGVRLLPSLGGSGGAPAAPASPPPSSPAATGSFTRLAEDRILGDVPWPHGRLLLTMPVGWSSAAGTPGWPAQAGTTITRYPLDDPGRTLTSMSLVHDVTRVVVDVCVEGGHEAFVDVGPTVADLTTALSNQVGVQTAGPLDVTVGGYPAAKFVLTMPSTELACPGPEGKRVWANATTNGLVLLKDGTTTIYVVDVNGDRLVITSLERGASAADVAQLDAIVASIEIHHEGVTPPCVITPSSCGALGVERYGLTVEEVPLSFSAPGWTPFGRVSLNKNIVGPQAAEGIIYWTTFPDGALAHRCANLSSLPVDASAADLAAAVSAAPGTDLVTRPSDVTVGGRPAKHVVVTVRERLGCDTSFFLTWHDYRGGPLWAGTDVGDTIRVWIVDVDGTRLFIAAETHAESRPGYPLSEANRSRLEQEIQQIVDSIQFE